MARTILFYGLVAGLLVGVPLFGITVSMNGHRATLSGMVMGYLIMLVALSAIFIGTKRYRDIELGGVIGFWTAFGLGIGISVIASVVYVAAWEAALAATHMDFAGSYARAVVEQQQARGLHGEAMATLVAKMERFKIAYSNPLYRLSMTFVEIFPIGLLVSLATAALLRNSGFFPARRTEHRNRA